uniref:Uncharacterized protein n=1 Tax=Glossina brevipalpis TaxID=37001 RepID=A0A1A9WRL5_9MUSC
MDYVNDEFVKRQFCQIKFSELLSEIMYDSLSSFSKSFVLLLLHLHHHHDHLCMSIVFEISDICELNLEL